MNDEDDKINNRDNEDEDDNDIKVYDVGDLALCSQIYLCY